MIKLVRIDYRLLHGQVVFAWTRALDIDHIIVANANAAGDAFVSMSLSLAKPAGVSLDIITVEQAAEKLASGKLDHKASVWKCARFRLIPPNCLTINSEPGGHYVAHRNAARPDCRTGHS